VLPPHVRAARNPPRAMRVHCIKHVEYEGLGSIGAWLGSRGCALSYTRPYLGESFPSARDLDWLIVMGGPMGAADDDRYPWLGRERELVGEAIEAGKTVLGICLGAQLMAASLGASVFRNAEREIGWFAVEILGGGEGPLAGLPRSIEAFHWHRDTFDLPAGARRLARSEACENQAFSVGEKALGLQFHLEVTPGTVEALVGRTVGRRPAGQYVQGPDEILSGVGRCDELNRMMAKVLDNLASS